MKNSVGFLLVVLLLIGFASQSRAQIWQYPVIQNYGGVYPLPNAAVQPDKFLGYKIIFGISKAADNNNKVNPGLEHIAQLINVYASAGVMPDKMKLVAVVYGPATPIVLTTKNYKAQFGMDNPNAQLIADLKKNGVILYVCGQSALHNNIEPGWIDPNFTLALSSLVVLPTYKLMGYALMPW